MPNPFETRMQEGLQQGAKDIKTAEEEIQKAELAGADVSDLRRSLDEQKERHSKLQAVYGAKQ